QPRRLGRAYAGDPHGLWRQGDLHALVVAIARALEGPLRAGGRAAVPRNRSPLAGPRRGRADGRDARDAETCRSAARALVAPATRIALAADRLRRGLPRACRACHVGDPRSAPRWADG